MPTGLSSGGGGTVSGPWLGAGPGGSTSPPGTDITVGTVRSVYGQVIPLSSGRRGIEGAPIWATERQYETITPGDNSGKTATVRVTRRMAYSFGYNLAPEEDHGVVGVFRIWMNGVLIYDAQDGSVGVNYPNVTWTFYGGTPDQLPDPDIVADKGDVTPAFRNMIYIVIKSIFEHSGAIAGPPPSGGGGGGFGQPVGGTAGFVSPQLSDTLALPTLKVEMIDGLEITTEITDYEMLEGETVSSGTMLAKWDDVDGSLLISFSGQNTSSGFLHTFDAEGYVQLAKVAITGLVDGIAYINVGGVDHASFWDVNNGLIIFSANTVANTEPILTINDSTGAIIDQFGVTRLNTTPANALGDPDGPYTSVPHQTTGGLARVCEGNVIKYALISGSIFEDISMVPYLANGTWAADIPEDASMRIAAAGNLHFVHPLPIIETQNILGRLVDPNQDGACIIGIGRTLRLIYFGMRDGQPRLMGSTILKTYPVGYSVIHGFSVPGTEHSGANIVVVVENDLGDEIAECFLCNYTRFMFGSDPPTGATEAFRGLRPVVYSSDILNPLGPLNAVWSTAIPGINDGPEYQSTMRGSRLTAGTLGWAVLSSDDVAILNLKSGYVKVTENTSHDAGAWVWDSITRLGHYVDDGEEIVKVLAASAASGSEYTIGDFLFWIGLQLEYEEDAIDVDAALDDDVLGMILDHPHAPAQLFGDLGKLYDFFYYESEGKIKFTRVARGEESAGADVDLEIADLALLGDEDVLITTLNSPQGTPLSLAAIYIDFTKDYARETQTFTQDTEVNGNAALGTQKMDIPVVMTGGEMYSRLSQVSIAAQEERVIQEFRLPWRYSRLEPADILSITLPPYQYTIRLDEVTFNADYSLSCAGMNFAFNNDIVIPPPDDYGGLDQIVPGRADARVLALDIPLLYPEMDTFGSGVAYVMTAAATFGQTNWPGTDIFWKPLALIEESLQHLYKADIEPVHGTVQGTVPTTTTPFATDETTTINLVCRGNKTALFADTDAAGLLEGSNAVLIGAEGRWELIHFRDVEIVNPRLVRITGLNRGRRGTDVNCNNHAAGDQFVLVRSVQADFELSLREQAYTASEDVDQEFLYQSQSVLATNTYSTNLTLVGNSLKPWAPVFESAVAEMDDDIVITWQRRDRLGGEDWLTEDLPLSESAEAYEVDILDGPGGAVLRTLSASAENVTYSAANQTTDGFTAPAATLSIRIYQISGIALIDRGFSKEVTFNV